MSVPETPRPDDPPHQAEVADAHAEGYWKGYNQGWDDRRSHDHSGLHRDCYTHDECGFHWHNATHSMDIPLTRGIPFLEPVCPWCELTRLREAVDALCAEAEYVVLAENDPGTPPVRAVAVTDLHSVLNTPEAEHS
jgi:hypothetical protein